jgi:hypothetical protein
MEEGDAGRIKLWKEMIEEEVEKVNVDIGYNRILENMKLDGEIDNGKK